MAGADFVRADLHVHTIPDGASAATHALDEYVRIAIERDVAVLGITDHNTVRNVRPAIAAAAGTGLLILPGIEITTHEGHLLALFDPDHVVALEDLVAPSVLGLRPDPRDGAMHSVKGMLELIDLISARGGLAIPAHIDSRDGLSTSISGSGLASLLSSPGLAGIEFTDSEALQTWFTSDDSDGVRKSAWQARQAVPSLAVRGLARLMSSDAHSPDKVGQDRRSRTLTRLRLGDRNFQAVKNAIVNSPRARCKPEVTLPPSYPRIISVEFKGGFLHGVSLDFSPNLNCVIGGRGSGKSTALLAISAALGAGPNAAATNEPADDPDDPDRMPSKTTIHFIDELGSERTAVRHIGGSPVDPATQSPVALELQGFGQDETGRLARGYRTDPLMLLRFLDQFVDLTDHDTAEHEILAGLGDNEAEILQTNTGISTIGQLETELRRLEAQLTAAQKSRLEDVAIWAGILASEGPFLENLGQAIRALASVDLKVPPIDLDRFAADFGIDLSRSDVQSFVEGPAGLRAYLQHLYNRRIEAGGSWQTAMAAAADGANRVLADWRRYHDDLVQRLDAKQRELEAQGLRVEAGAVRSVAARIESIKAELTHLRARRDRQNDALRSRVRLVAKLHSNREARFERRRAIIKRILAEANASGNGFTIHMSFHHESVRNAWKDWLTPHFNVRSPRADRIAAAVTPRTLAENIRPADGVAQLLTFTDESGAPCFSQAELDQYLPALRYWQTIFELEKMRLEDSVEIHVQEAGSSSRRSFDHLSTGQQRSVLLSLVLCSQGRAPLILDQPEDHLDGPYVATALVGHLEAAKERRQVIVATHSANLTVLGDAELVIPMYADGGQGAPRDPGAVEHPATRDRVCELLEGDWRRSVAAVLDTDSPSARHGAIGRGNWTNAGAAWSALGGLVLVGHTCWLETPAMGD